MDDYEPKPVMYDTLVLSGGAFKGLILLGSLHALYIRNMHNQIVNFVGTSCGAMICYLLAIGYTPIEIFTYICTRLILDNIHVDIVSMMNGQGATSYNIIQEHLEKLTIEKIGYLPTLLDVKTKYNKTLTISAYNYTRKKEEILSYVTHPDLPCLIAIRMSANLPLIFDHFKYQGSYYVDGGLINNFPIDIGEQVGAKTLGIFIQPVVEKETREIPKSMIEYIYQLVLIPVRDSIERKIDRISSSSTTIIRLEHGGSNFTFPLTTKEKVEMFDHGYDKLDSFLV